ncbi:SMI1/KNR4 family protein [Massilia violaceinigra]|uniref:SMI1/KNR4 family protein n=1 Tax=Massilia violaceinigra TaxID=2045208 RepID=A0ABY4AE37_9BURK|nr:SMI1/KNR4 family protein [Massilia violaceinigra]UOD33065.1 SMI1/KNR4 family protein [Massilia violaceinigra]
MNIDRLSARHINPPASRTAIEQVEAQLGMRLPDAYRELLACANGIRFDNGLVVYPLDDVIERNQTLEVGDYAPGYLAIGDDSGGQAVMLSLASGAVLLVDMGSMDPDAVAPISQSLPSWIADKCRLRVE